MLGGSLPMLERLVMPMRGFPGRVRMRDGFLLDPERRREARQVHVAVLILETVGINSGRIDRDCAVLHANMHERRKDCRAQIGGKPCASCEEPERWILVEHATQP